MCKFLAVRHQGECNILFMQHVFQTVCLLIQCNSVHVGFAFLTKSLDRRRSGRLKDTL